MTKREQEIMNRWNYNITKNANGQIDRFERMMSLSKELDGEKWCNLEKCLDYVVTHGDENQRRKAIDLYRDYINVESSQQVLGSLLQALVNE
jgi:hypothetical protein